jgi:hypothetical protein
MKPIPGKPRATPVIEVSPEIVDQALQMCADSTTGLFAISHLSDGKIGSVFKGSGTIVRVRGRVGVLTAAHVWEKLSVVPEIGIAMADPSGGIMRVETSHVRPVICGLSPWSAWGPDLAVVVLPEAMEGTVTAYRTAYNLDQRRSDAISSAPETTLALWGFVGAPDEQATKTGTHYHANAIGHFGAVRAYHAGIQHSGFDYVDMAYDTARNPRLPVQFGGVSGGGLWQVPIHTDLKTGEVTLPHGRNLEGVAYWQVWPRTGEGTRGRGIIRCHGRESIYRKLYETFEAD